MKSLFIQKRKTATSKVKYVLMAAIFLLTIGFYSIEVNAGLDNTRMDTQGTLELSGLNWLSGGGVDVYSNGSNSNSMWGDNYQLSPTGVSVYTGYKWQCVELINRLYVKQGWITKRWPGNGGEMFEKAPTGFHKELNGQITYMNPGDVVVSTGGSGHVAIVNSIIDNGDGSKTVTTVNQNSVRVFLSSKLKNKTLASPDTSLTVKGIVHAPTRITTSKSRSDLAWYDGSTLYNFKGTGYHTTAAKTGYSFPSWAGVGSYANSDKEGVFWYDANSKSIYYIVGSDFESAQTVRGPGIGAPVWAGVGDFTGSGKRDSIAWYDGANLYLLAGQGLATKFTVSGYSKPEWSGVGDYNKDGKDDIFWYLASTSTIYVMTSNGQGFNGATPVRGPGIGAPTWAGVGDFDGNSYRNDLAWYAGGTLYTFTGSGLTTAGSTSGYSQPKWAGVGKWDSNNSNDGLLWYLGETSTIYGISSNGSTLSGATVLRGPGLGAPVWAETGNLN